MSARGYRTGIVNRNGDNTDRSYVYPANLPKRGRVYDPNRKTSITKQGREEKLI